MLILFGDKIRSQTKPFLYLFQLVGAKDPVHDDQLKRISEEVGAERSLLICCKAFMAEGAEFPNLTLKKIPKVILNKCEWDHDDYSFTLNVLPEEQQGGSTLC